MHNHTLTLTTLVSGGDLGAASEVQAKSLLIALPCPAQAVAPKAAEALKHLALAPPAFNALIFCQIGVLKRSAKMAELKVWHGKWLGNLAGSSSRRWMQEFWFLAEVRCHIVKMERPGELRIINEQFQDVTDF